MRKFKHVLALVLVFALLLSCVGMASAAVTDEITVKGKTQKEERSARNKGALSEEFEKLNAYKYADNETVRAIVVLESAPEADYEGTASQRAAYRLKLNNERARVYKGMEQKMSFDVAYEFTTLLNGFSCDVAYGELEDIAAIEGVSAVYIANSYAEPTLETPKNNISAVMTGNAQSNRSGYNGEGMVIAVLDTGLRITEKEEENGDITLLASHEAFQVYKNMPLTETITEADLVKAVAPGEYLSAKVPFAYDYADKDNNVADNNGHGTHVSGTALGYAETEEGVVIMSGGAPAAQLLSMKIFKDKGRGTSSDIYFYALEDAYRLGADVVNMSIGAQNGFTYDEGLETEVFGNIYKRMEAAGIVMCVSAGNEYSMAYYSSLGGIYTDYADYGVVGSPSTYEGNLSIASVNNAAYPDFALTFRGENLIYIDSCDDGEHGWIDNFAETTPEVVVLKTVKEDGTVDIANGYASDYEGIDVTDKIAVVSRGDITFQEKVDFAAAAGAVGLIVCNNDETRISMSIDPFPIPAVSVMIDAREIFLAAEEGDTLYTPAEKTYVENPEGYLMSEFSNWGTSPMLTLDPTITSVGGAVLSSVPTGDSDYEVYSGTSMAAPNAAGTFACVLQMLKDEGYYLGEDGEWYLCDKVQRMQRAVALMESTGVILYDADGYIYSVRKQGAGLANSAYSISSYLNAGYIANPIQELGDDKEKTGVYTMTLNLVNEGYGDVVYNYLDAYILYDYAEAEVDAYNRPTGNYINTLTSDYLNYYADITFTVDGEEVEEITLYSGSSLEVVVTITLNDTIKAYLDRAFPNGTFVEGYVSFAAVTDEGEIEEETHATFLAFYGDWLQGPVMESANSFDYAEIDYIIHANPAYKPYLDAGYTALNFMEYYTDINWAYTLNTDGDATANLLGANFFDYGESADMGAHEATNTPFMPEHIAITTPETDATFYYAGDMYIIPNLLRNTRHIVMTISDKETGEVYYVDDTEYIPKDAYDYETGVWQNYSVFQWGGTAADGETYLPSGTVVTVSFDAQLPYGEAADEWQEDVWSFDLTVDSTAPVIEDIELDLEANTLTVTASDEQYLAAIYLVSEDYSEVYAVETISSDEQGAAFTATFDLNEIDAKTCLVTAMDYATNENEYYMYLFEEGIDTTLTLVTPVGKTVIETVTGEEIELPEAEEYNGHTFIGWSTAEYNQAQAKDITADVYAAGDFLVTDTDMVLYALYGKGTVVEYDTIQYELNFGNVALEGPYSIVGWPADLSAGMYIPTDPYVLNAKLGETRVADLEDAEISTEQYEYRFATNDIGGLFEIVPMEAYGAYVLMSYANNGILACNGTDLTMQSIDTLTTAGLWTIELDGGYAYMYNYAYESMILLFDYQTNEFVLFDDSVPYSGSYYPSDLFNLYFYYAFDTEEDMEYYTTVIDVCKLNGHKYNYTDNGNMTHTIGCDFCDFSEITDCDNENGACVCGSLAPIYDANLQFTHSLTLENDISINFYIKTAMLSEYDSFYLECTVPVYEGNEKVGTKTVEIQPVYVGTSYEFALTGVTAKMMNDEIEAVCHLTKDGREYYSKTDIYSVAKYAYSKLNSTNAAYTDELKAICANLLRYGALAQVQFNYRTDALVDAEMTDANKAFLTDLSTVEMNDYRKQLNDHATPAVPWKSTTLELGNKVIMCLIVNLENYTGDPSELTMRLSFTDSKGRLVTEERPLVLYNSEAQTYAVSYDGLRATEMRTIVSAAIYNGETRVSKTVEYSIESYGARAAEFEIQELCLAMLAYGDAANAFFAG